MDCHRKKCSTTSEKSKAQNKSLKAYCEDPENFDQAMEMSGGCGYFQIKRHVMFFVMTIPFSCQNLLMVFAGMNPGWEYVDRNISNSDMNASQSLCSMQRSQWQFRSKNSLSIITEVSDSVNFLKP